MSEPLRNAIGTIETRGAERCPLTDLVGSRQRDRVTSYATDPFMKAGAEPYRNVLSEAEGYLEGNFAAIKLRCGIALRSDAEIVKAPPAPAFHSPCVSVELDRIA
jgi:hypothetical protein